MNIAFIGPDMTGKSNIASALSKQMNIPVFKNTGEWKTALDSEDYFLNLLRFGGPFLMDFMSQVNCDVILDRFYPCELAYSRVFGRSTDEKAIKWLDKEYSSMGGKFIVCFKRDYTGLVDDVYPDSLTPELLKNIESAYRDFLKITECDYTILYTDDQNLESQLKHIKEFLSTEK
jgi:thymidylate kinase